MTDGAPGRRTSTVKVIVKHIKRLKDQLRSAVSPRL